MNQDPPNPLGPYRIERLLGVGGMGEVHLAYDRRLERRVAIKHIRPEVQADSTTRARLRREARAVAGLSHPAIVQIFDILETEQGDWIVMEFVDGKSVLELLREGPLAVSMAVDLGRQVAAGLAEAHRKGILHRDLKSENVMVEATGRAKILDFGLAKRLWDGQHDVSITLVGGILGTPRAMSPEQARGLPLDRHSDLFSLGTLLYEMVTAESPFQGATPIDTLTRICTHRQLPAGERNPLVQPELSGLIDGLLQKEPSQRPDSIDQVQESLAALAPTLLQVAELDSQLPTPDPPLAGPPSAAEPEASQIPNPNSPSKAVVSSPQAHRGEPSNRRPWPYRPGGLITTTLATLVLAGLAFLLWPRSRDNPEALAPVNQGTRPVAARRSVAVLGLKNLSASPQADWMSTALSEMLTAELAADDQLRTIAGENVARAQLELTLAEGKTLAAESLDRLRSFLGADLVVLGSYLVVPEAGNQLHLVVSVQETTTAETVATLQETGTQGDVLTLVGGLGESLRQHLGSGLVSAGRAHHVQASLPGNPEALRFYSEGLSLLRSRQFVAARRRLALAIGADPDHPLSHAAMAEAWSALGYDRKAAEAAAKAVELAGDLAREERLFVEARHHEISMRWDLATEGYRTLYEFFPDNLDYGLRLVEVLSLSGRPREAVKMVDSLRRLPSPSSDDVRLDLAEARAAIVFADFATALTVARVAARKAESRGSRAALAEAQLIQARVLRRMGEPEQAASMARAARGLYAELDDYSREAQALNTIATILSQQGAYGEGRQIFQQMLTKMRQVGDLDGIASALNNLGASFMKQGDLAAAQPLIGEALSVARSAGDLRMAGALSTTAALLALHQGHLQEAQATAEEALRLTRQLDFTYATSAGLEILGKILLARGETATARAQLEEGLQAARRSGAQHRTASFLYNLGNLHALHGERSLARARHEEALRIRKEVQAPVATARSQVALAQLLIEEGHAEEALAGLREARATFTSRDIVDQETYATAVLTSAWRSLSRTTEMAESAARVDELLPRCQDVANRLRVTLEMAPSWRALGHGERAVRLLESTRRDASRLGFAILEEKASRELDTLESATAQ